MGAIEAWAKEKLEAVWERFAGATWGILVLLGLVVLYFAWKAGTPWFLAAILASMALLASEGRR
jgi:hypothetical protein